MTVPEAETLSEAMDALRSKGYTDDFRIVADEGTLRCSGCGADVDPERLVVEDTSRFEGPSNPGDESILLALRCPECERRGLLVSAYNADATFEEGQVLRKLVGHEA